MVSAMSSEQRQRLAVDIADNVANLAVYNGGYDLGQGQLILCRLADALLEKCTDDELLSLVRTGAGGYYDGDE